MNPGRGRRCPEPVRWRCRLKPYQPDRSSARAIGTASRVVTRSRYTVGYLTVPVALYFFLRLRATMIPYLRRLSHRASSL